MKTRLSGLIALALSLILILSARGLAAERTSEAFRLSDVLEWPALEQADSSAAASDEQSAAPQVFSTVQESGDLSEPIRYRVNLDPNLMVDVHAGASLRTQTITQLYGGFEVDVIGYEGDWSKILLPDDIVGFTQSRYLTEAQAVAAPDIIETEEPAAQGDANNNEETPAAPEIVEELEAAPEPEATGQPEAVPTEEPEEEPVEEPETVLVEEPEIIKQTEVFEYERNEDGSLKLDESGNPTLIDAEGLTMQPVSYMRDANGELLLDENGDPIAVQLVPVEGEIIDGEQDEAAPERRIDIYLDWATEAEQHAYGDEAVLTAVLTGYEGLTYEYQWQTGKDEASYVDVEGATDSTYTFRVTPENLNNYWRVEVTVTGETA